MDEPKWKVFLRYLSAGNTPINWWQYFALIATGAYIATVLISAVVIYIPGKLLIAIEGLMYLPSIEGWPYVIIALVLMAVAFWELAMAPIRSALPKIIGFIFYSVLAAGLIRTLPYQAQPVPDGPAFIVTAVVGFICFIATMVLIVRCIINKKYSLANAAIVVTLLTPAILTIATYLLSGFGVIEIGPGPDPNTIQL